jgi:hypothetical protein
MGHGRVLCPARAMRRARAIPRAARDSSRSSRWAVGQYIFARSTEEERNDNNNNKNNRLPLFFEFSYLAPSLTDRYKKKCLG